MFPVPQHPFLPEPLVQPPHLGTPLPPRFAKKNPPPVLCALMTDLLAPRQRDKVLEVGTGLGYQTAILAEMAHVVWSVEIIEEFAEDAQRLLDQLGYANVRIRTGNGSRGWAEHAPFDKIMVTAATGKVPPALIEQLQPSGRLVMPLGPFRAQQLTVVERTADGTVHSRAVMPVRFTQLE